MTQRRGRMLGMLVRCWRFNWPLPNQPLEPIAARWAAPAQLIVGRLRGTFDGR
jgi:hypothetical protein